MTDTTVITSSPPASPPAVTSISTSSTNTDGWKYRRRFMFAITLFDMGVILIALLAAKQESVAQIAVIMAFGSLTAIFGFYVAGAVWDDHSIRTTQMQGLAFANKPGGAPAPDCDHGGGDGHQGP